MEDKERIELHCHSTFSGKATTYPGELIRHLSELGMTAFAITDETGIDAWPELESVWEIGVYTSRPIYGMEMSVTEDGQTSFSVSVLIRNEAGKKTVYHMLSENKSGERYPVFRRSELLKNRDGLLIGSGTDRGEIYSLFQSAASDEICRDALSVYDYVEVLPFTEYKEVNERIVRLCGEVGIPVVAVSDARYISKVGRKALAIMNHWNKEAQETNSHHIRSTEEMLDAFAYLGNEKAYEIVIENTHKIADMCESVSICPKEKHYPTLENAEEKLRNLCMAAIDEKYPDCRKQALERVEWELAALHETGMEFYILHIVDLLEKSHLSAHDISFRGTSAGSILTYLVGINEVDPIKYNLVPEMIYGIKKTREIDIDINVPSSRLSEVHGNVERLEGIKKAVYGGNLQFVSESLAVAMIERYEMDYECFFEEDLRNKLKWCIRGNALGRGKHPGGMVVFPNDCEYLDITPVTRISRGFDITYFQYYDVDMAFIKYDILKHDSLDMLMKLSDRTGVNICQVPVNCEEVMELFGQDEDGTVTRCAELPEFKNEHVREAIAMLKPDCFDDLVKIIAMMHGTGSWTGNAEILIREKGIGIKELIGDRDDVFEYNLSLGLDRETAFSISEAIRKGIVARGKNAKWQGWKKQLVEAGAPEWYIWSCEQIRYLFPRAHAVSYLFMNMRLGWFKVYYPQIFAEVINEYNVASVRI